MVTLSKREWDIMKYPVYPSINIITQGMRMQVQTMVRIDDEEYYLPCIVVRDLLEVDGLRTMADLMDESVMDIKATYKIDEGDENLYKIVD